VINFPAFSLLDILGLLVYNDIRGNKMTILEFIETFIDPINTDFGTMILSLGIISFLAIGLTLLKVPSDTTLTTIIISLFMFISFGWIPIWIIILLAIGLFVLIFLIFKGGLVG
jgi:hypothetical protein